MKLPTFFTDLALEHQTMITQMMKDKADPIIIKSEMKKVGVTLSLTQIRELFDVCEVNNETNTKVVEVAAKPTIVGIRDLLERFDVPQDLSDIDNSVSAIQRLTQQIFMLESTIRLAQLEDYVNGDSSYPNHSVRGYRSAYDVMSAALSLKDIVSVKAAIKTLEIEGYAVKEINRNQETSE